MNPTIETRVDGLEEHFGDITPIACELLDAVREIVMGPSDEAAPACSGDSGASQRLSAARARLVQAIELKPPDPYTQHLLRMADAMLGEESASP